MMKARAKKRRGWAVTGRVVRDPGGYVEMIEFSEYTPNVLAPSILVDQVLGIYKVSEGGGLIKVTFGLATTGRGGAREVVERASLIWTPGRVLKANEMCSWFFRQYQAGTFSGSLPDDGGGRRPRTQ